jgi:flagellar protein FliO/FliZ
MNSPRRPFLPPLRVALLGLTLGAALAASPLRAGEDAALAVTTPDPSHNASIATVEQPAALPITPATAATPTTPDTPDSRASSDERILYPRNAAERSAAAVEPRPRGPNYLGLLAFGGLCAAGGVWLLKRGGLRGRLQGMDTRRLQIEETRPLGNRQFLAVAAYGDRRLLLAVCPGRIDLLCPLEEPATTAPTGLAADSTPPARSSAPASSPRPDVGR